MQSHTCSFIDNNLMNFHNLIKLFFQTIYVKGFLTNLYPLSWIESYGSIDKHFNINDEVARYTEFSNVILALLSWLLNYLCLNDSMKFIYM